jgi:hypothetical protein
MSLMFIYKINIVNIIKINLLRLSYDRVLNFIFEIGSTYDAISIRISLKEVEMIKIWSKVNS